MKKLSELNPRPRPGEWYSVLTIEDGKERIMVRIDESPTLAQLPHAGVSGIAYFFDPQKRTYEEAKIQLRKEILSMKKDAEAPSYKLHKGIYEIFIRDMIRFYEKTFKERYAD